MSLAGAGERAWLASHWWQRLPACLAAGHDAVLVTVVRVSGSTPREPGASMLVELDRCTDTIGGGNLEFAATATARAWLAGDPGSPMMPYTLGPGLRQCCGGALWLLYERIAASPENCATWQRHARALQTGSALLRQWRADDQVSVWHPLPPAAQHETGQLSEDRQCWQQVVGRAGFPLRLFGAGHVGAALAQVLALTEARLQWIDSRPEMVEAVRPLGLPVRLAAEPLDAVHDALPGSAFIVMTHSHTLDFELVEAILRRRDAAFCGLIGSRTKAARFRHNLRKQGLDAAMIAGLTCPLGIDGIHDKAPAAVAISIAAQILQWRESLPRANPLSVPLQLLASPLR